MDLSLDHRIIAALRRIVRAIDLHSRQLVEQSGITGPQLLTLQTLVASGPLSIGDLARGTHVGNATMTGIVSRLERRGWVERSRDDRDRRRVTVVATEAGRAVVAEAPSLLHDRFRAELAKLREWERTQMLATLQHIATMMDVDSLDAAPLLTSGAEVGEGVQSETPV